MDNLSPTKAFIKVDFPTLGLPIIFTKPDLCIKQEIKYANVLKKINTKNGLP
ncbi:hypothetical protein RCZ01_19970 [Capnocytophaga felis]|uniref:Uncharacterized protein n=1 Tax=Capnocytophaga felis TaxID=2267611 RepID=A0A5M4BBR0_9FLAO|nr:hypothetical protein RCZ01_19970 [Capnocytophaga felis]